MEGRNGILRGEICFAHATFVVGNVLNDNENNGLSARKLPIPQEIRTFALIYETSCTSLFSLLWRVVLIFLDFALTTHYYIY